MSTGRLLHYPTLRRGTSDRRDCACVVRRTSRLRCVCGRYRSSSRRCATASASGSRAAAGSTTPRRPARDSSAQRDTARAASARGARARDASRSSASTRIGVAARRFRADARTSARTWRTPHDRCPATQASRRPAGMFRQARRDTQEPAVLGQQITEVQRAALRVLELVGQHRVHRAPDDRGLDHRRGVDARRPPRCDRASRNSPVDRPRSPGWPSADTPPRWGDRRRRRRSSGAR